MPARRQAKPSSSETPQANTAEFEWVNFTDTLDNGDSPKYRQAINGDEARFWLAAIEEELANQKTRKSYKAVETPPGASLIGSVWVLKRKRGRNGEIVRYKARLCAAGNMQKQGDTYDETFAPTPSVTSLRILLAFAVSKSWTITQLDVVSAFLIPKLPDTTKIYMRPPAGMKLPFGWSLLLQRALYGLHQSARLWHAEIDGSLRSIDFIPTDADPCVYTMTNGSGVIACLLIHIDDILLTASKNLATRIAKQLMSLHSMTNSGQPSWILGFAVDYNLERGILRLHQKTYVNQLLEKFSMTNCNPCKTPAAALRLTAM